MNWDEQERMDQDARTLLVYSSSEEEDLPALRKVSSTRLSKTPRLGTRLEIEDGPMSGLSDHDYSVSAQAQNTPLHTCTQHGHPKLTTTSAQSIN